MLEIDGKYYAGVEGSIQILKQLVAQHYNTQRVLTALDIKVIGQIDNASQLPIDFTGAFGDAYAVGAEHPYDLYIWTRTDQTGTQGYWFNIGPIAILGPQGPQGERGPQGPAGKNVKIYIVQSADELWNYEAVEGDLGIDSDGDLWRYNGRQWLLEFNIKGPQGAQGARGPQGIQGEQGPQGPQGPRGDVGGFIKIIGNLTSIDQLPQPSALGDLTAAYIVGTERNLYIQVGPTSEDAIWTNVGPLNVATLVTVGGEYQNIWDADTKVTKDTSTGGWWAYGRKQGEERMLRLNTTPAEWSLPLYGTNGVIYTNDPTLSTSGDINKACTNKKYVDDLAATKLDVYTGQGGNYLLYGVDSNGQTQKMYQTNSNNHLTFVARWGSSGSGTTNNGGYLTTADPVNLYHAATKNYVDTGLAGKVDIFTVQGDAGDKAYVAKSNGTQGTTFIADGENHIAQYYPSTRGDSPTRGYLWGRDPIRPYQVATKNYVDTKATLYEHSISITGAMGEQIYFTFLSKQSTPYTDLSFINTSQPATGYVGGAFVVAFDGLRIYTVSPSTSGVDQTTLTAVGQIIDNVRAI